MAYFIISPIEQAITVISRVVGVYGGKTSRYSRIWTTEGKVYTRDYVVNYTSFENDDLMVFAEGNGHPEYEQKHVYAGSERIEQFTDKGEWERTLYVHEDVMGSTRYYTKSSGQSFAELTYDADNRIWLAMDPIKDGGNWYQYCSRYHERRRRSADTDDRCCSGNGNRFIRTCRCAGSIAGIVRWG